MIDRARRLRRIAGARWYSATAVAAVIATGAGATVALAQSTDVCGGQDGGNVTCAAPGNPYASGIRYTTPPAQPGADVDNPATEILDLIVTLEPGVEVVLAGDASVAGAVELSGRQGAAVVLAADNTTRITTSGGQFGIAARTDRGAITIRADEIETTGRSGGGISTNSQGGGATFIAVNRIDTVGENAAGIEASALRGGDVTIDAGTIDTTGTGGIGVRLTGSDPARFAVRADAITTAGAGAHGVLATPGAAALSLSIGSIATAGQDAGGVLVDFATGTVAVEADRVSTTGDGATALFVRTQAEGDIAVAMGEAATTGERADAIRAAAENGDVSVTARGAITTAGVGAAAIVGSSATGNVDMISAGRIATTGAADAAGVQLLGAGSQSAVSAIVTDVSTTGVRSRGVDIRSGNFASATVTGAVSTIGMQSSGVTIVGGNGGATFDHRGRVTTTGTDSLGVDVRAPGAIAITGNGSIATRGAGALGLYVESDDTVLASLGSIETEGDHAAGARLVTSSGELGFAFESVATAGAGAIGIDARTGTAGRLRGTVGTVAAGGENSRGISLTGGGELALQVGNVSTAGAGSEAIFAFMAGNSTINAGTVATSGNGARGIAAASVLGDLSASLTNGTTTGEAAILADLTAPAGSVAFTSTGTLSVAGPRSALVVARGTNASVSVGNARIDGLDSAGIRVEADQLAIASVAGTIADMASSSGFKQVIAISGGREAVVTNTGSIVATGAGTAGILASSPGAVTIGGNGNISTTGVGGYGIQAAAVSGPVQLMQGSVRTAGNAAAGIIARSRDVVRVDVGGVATAGGDSLGILVESDRDGIVRAGRVETQGLGASAGILVNAADRAIVEAGDVSVRSGTVNAILARGGAATVTTTGAVTAAGDGTAAAIQVSAARGPATATVASVRATGTGRSALFLESVSTAAATIRGGATVSGSVDGIILAGRGGNSLLNDGTLIGGTGAAVRSVGGMARIDNRGVLRGAVVLTDENDAVVNLGDMTLSTGTKFGAGDDTLTNAGAATFIGAVDFGDGNDRVVNTGTLTMGPGTMLGAGDDAITNRGVVVLTGSIDLGTGDDLFANTGTLRLALGAAPRTAALTGLERFTNDGVIALADGVAGDVLSLPGTYVGGGAARLTVDVRNDATSVADRLVIGGAATGTTSVAVQYSGTTPSFERGVTLVQGGTGTSATAFVLDAGSRNRGLIDYALLFDAAGNRFDLVAAPSATALRIARLGEGLRFLSYGAGDAISEQLRTERDATSAGDTADGERVWLQFFGQVADRDNQDVFVLNGITQPVAYDYRQDAFGGQLGVGLFSSGTLRAGITGGYQNSTLRFRGLGERFGINAYNVGGYAGLSAGNAFLNVTARYERYDIDYMVPALGIAQGIDADGIGARAEAGIRFGDDTFFVEPRVGVNWTRTDINDFGAGGLGFALDRADGLRGDAGARLGSRVELAGGNVLTLYGGGDVVHPFGDDDRLRVSSGTSGADVTADRIGTYGRAQLGFTVSSGSVTGFVQGEGLFGGPLSGGGGRAGLRIAW